MAPIGVAGGSQGVEAGVWDRDHRPLYDAAVFGLLTGGEWRELLRYRSPVGGPGHRFGAPSREGGRVWLCTERDVVAWPDGERLDHPHFSDLHHVAPCAEGLLAVSTGAGGVVDARTGRSWPSHPEARLGRPSLPDLRGERLRDAVHPNHVCTWRGRTWVTRGVAGDVVPLGGGAGVRVADVVVHDGIPGEEGLWFTAVDGRLVLVDPDARRILRTVRIHDGTDGPLGWCRGLWVEGGTAWVGMTRLRTTRARRNLAWLKSRVEGRPGPGTKPTRVLRVSLEDGRVTGEWPTEEHGVHAIFGLVGMEGG